MIPKVRDNGDDPESANYADLAVITEIIRNSPPL
jgi:hypothetical protein